VIANSRYQAAQPTPTTVPARIKQAVKVFGLQFAKAKDLAGTLNGLFQRPDRSVRIEADERTNSIIVSGEEFDLDAVEALIKRLDQESKEATNPTSPLRSS
jgi:type II secretory pathway component GspD/PulD (secretin)